MAAGPGDRRPSAPLAARGNLDPLLAALDAIVRYVATLSGLGQENMTRGTGWLFLDLGRRIERAQFVLNSALGPFQQSPIDWDAAMRLALELCDSTITYRWRYLGQLQPAPVLDLVVLDDSNPRSFAFQLRSIRSHLERLGQASGAYVRDTLEGLDGDLTRAVQLFAGEEKAWRHEGLALGCCARCRGRGAAHRRAVGSDHPRLLQPRAGIAGRGLDDKMRGG
jgi:uncharacterized alpha-E superfamily protein